MTIGPILTAQPSSRREAQERMKISTSRVYPTGHRLTEYYPMLHSTCGRQGILTSYSVHLLENQGGGLIHSLLHPTTTAAGTEIRVRITSVRHVPLAYTRRADALDGIPISSEHLTGPLDEEGSFDAQPARDAMMWQAEILHFP